MTTAPATKSNPSAAAPPPPVSSLATCFLEGRGPWAFLVALLVTTLFALSTTLLPIRADNDCWWHVKTGQYISENGLPTHDVFSYTAADHEWHNHEWLSQVLYYQAYLVGEASGLGGWRGVILFTGIIVWLTCAVLLWLSAKLSSNWWIGLLVVVISITVGRRMFYNRPPVITNLMLAAELALLVGVAEGWFRRRFLFLLVPMIALWTNLHGGWMAGGVVFAAFVAEQFLALLGHRLPPHPFDRPARVAGPKMLVALGALVLLATLANPYIYKLYLLPGRVLSNQELVASIGELASPNFFFVVDFELIVMGAFVLALFGRSFRPRLFELAIYLFFLHQAFQHVRHLSLFSIMLVPLYARLVAEAVSRSRLALGAWGGATRLWLRFVPGMGCLAVAVLLAGWVEVNPREGGSIRNILSPATYVGRNAQYFRGVDYYRDAFPSKVADFIDLADLKGRMFNENYYAGYLIWRLAPEKQKVFSDPRFDIFGGEIWESERQIALGDTRLLDKFEIQWLITRSDKALSLILERDPKWKISARWPEGWEVWIRNVPENAAMIDRAAGAAPMTGAEAP